jgi:hypothetical protein
MATQKRSARAEEQSGTRRRVSADEKIARLLAMLLVKDIKKKTDQVPLLRSAGDTSTYCMIAIVSLPSTSTNR